MVFNAGFAAYDGYNAYRKNSWKKKSSKNLISGWNVNITMVKINLELLQEIESAKMQLEIPYLSDNIGN
ncbi:hypothetical protein BK704_00850 [[Bacillus thuringiensis] serovar konkukian]|nr:hypothetical protein [Bacillus thuringiensis]OUB19314.1 hypothetical protein BK704_00850 [[Bacillus thuringiensis] serovar konkukian]